jgi:hypothetical protein
MSPERRRQIEEFYHAAWDHDPGERSALLFAGQARPNSAALSLCCRRCKLPTGPAYARFGIAADRACCRLACRCRMSTKSSGSRTLDNHLAGLRAKLERDPSRPEHIRTCMGVKPQIRRQRQFRDKNFASILRRAEIAVKTFSARGRNLEMAVGRLIQEGRVWTGKR